jgi:hypothetical protein
MREAPVGAARGGTGRAILVGLGLAAVLAMSLPGRAQDRPAGTAAEPARTLGPLEKSLLLPGWGQLSEKRYLEGFLFLAAEAAAIAGALVNDHLGNESYARYREAESMAEAVRCRGLTERYDKRRNLLLLGAAAVWAANLLDITLIVKSKAGGEKAVSLRIGSGTKDLIGATVACRF